MLSANFKPKTEELRRRAVSLRRRGFLVCFWVRSPYRTDKRRNRQTHGQDAQCGLQDGRIITVILFLDVGLQGELQYKGSVIWTAQCTVPYRLLSYGGRPVVKTDNPRSYTSAVPPTNNISHVWSYQLQLIFTWRALNEMERLARRYLRPWFNFRFFFRILCRLIVKYLAVYCGRRPDFEQILIDLLSVEEQTAFDGE